MSDPTGTRIMVTEDLADCGTSIMAIANQIGDQLSSLANLLAPLHDYWTGSSSTGWQDIQAAWNAAAADLMAAPGQLGAISAAATTNWQNYVDCETANTASWQN